ncbi:MAG: DHH family phosphoesterase [Burkholderiales bacterium]
MRVRYLTLDFWYLIVALAAAAGIAFYHSLFLGVVVSIFCIAYAVLYIAFGILQKIKWQQLVTDTLADKETFATYIDTMALPMALAAPSGSIKWANLAFRRLGGYGALRNINRMIPGINVPDPNKKIIIGDRAYKKELFKVKYRNKEMLLYRLVDLENAVEIKKLYLNYLPVVSYIQIDNYDELAADMLQSELSEMVASVEKRISEMARSLSSVFLRIDRGRYLCVFERRFLSALRNSKFRILDDVRQLKTKYSPTLSIAVGVGETPEQSADFATRALELALGRGGDQAVIKQGDKFIFFGGTVKTPYRRSKVKSRMVSHALRNLMEQCSEVFIMGHRSPDLDSMGASLGIAACARYVGKDAYLVIDDTNPSIEPLMERLKSLEQYSKCIITGQEAGLAISSSSLLVVVDTVIPYLTVYPPLIELAETMVVIDHHLKGASSIEEAALYYHEPYASSVSELVAELLQYFDEDIKPLNIELEALLCGITLDTKGFSFNTGARTFEAASFLKESGADSSAVRLLIQDDLETYKARTEIVKSAEILKDGIAVAYCPPAQNSSLVAAQAADALLTIRGVKASFVLSEKGGDIQISGRSLGEVNVQLILESLGGGGHASMAAAKLMDSSFETARFRLKEAIDNYVREGKLP